MTTIDPDKIIAAIERCRRGNRGQRPRVLSLSKRDRRELEITLNDGPLAETFNGVPLRESKLSGPPFIMLPDGSTEIIA